MLDELAQSLDRLNAAQRRFAIGDERRHAADPERLCLLFVGDDAFLEVPALQRRAQRLLIEPQPACKRDQHVDPADVFAALEECAKNRGIVVVESALRSRAVRRSMRQPRARLHRGQPDRHPQTLGHRVDGASPHAVQVLAVRVEGRDGPGAQLERTPDDAHLGIRRCEFMNGRLRQPTERSDVVGKDFQSDGIHCGTFELDMKEADTFTVTRHDRIVQVSSLAMTPPSVDLLIRGATVFDGLGSPGRLMDVAVKDGRIVEVGGSAKSGREVIEAAGLALMPGIIDVHTHYDAQVTWDPTLSPSPSLGVTTALIGNCGFGIAPCPAPLRETMLQNLSVVEGMDLDALVTGTQWQFETFPEYLDFVRRQRPYLNVAVYAGHSCIRTAVMGAEASTRAEPTPSELERMKRLVREAMDEGAVGFASSFSPNHFGYGGKPMPSTIATDDELRALVGVIGEAKKGVFMMATGPRATPEFMESMAADTGRPMFISTVLTMFNDAAPERAGSYYARCAEANARGHEVFIQTTCQPLSFDFSLLDPYLLLSHDAFDRVKAARPDALAAIYADPAFRARFRENLANPKPGILFFGDWSKVELEGRRISELALEAGKDPLDFFFDTALERGLDTQFIAKLFQNNDEGVAPLLKHPAGVIALSDAGAHLLYFCDAGFGLHFLSHWVRETGTFTLEEAIRRLTSDPAEKFRIPDRGRIAPGAWADLLLFDPSSVGFSPLMRVADLPGGGSRMIRKPHGVAGVWVNGVRVFDGTDYVKLKGGPGAVLDRFDS